MTLEEYTEERRKRVANMTLVQARDLIAKTLSHSDMELEFDKAVWMLLNCADEKISESFMEDVEGNNIVHVGDEIYSELTNSKAVVQRIDAWHRYQCFTNNGDQFIIDKHTFNEYWVKTGKNYPQIAEVLKQMKEGEDKK